MPRSAAIIAATRVDQPAGVALLAGEAEHQGDGAGAVDQLTAKFLQAHLSLLRLQHLVGGTRLQVRHPASGRGHR